MATSPDKKVGTEVDKTSSIIHSKINEDISSQDKESKETASEPKDKPALSKRQQKKVGNRCKSKQFHLFFLQYN